MIQFDMAEIIRVQEKRLTGSPQGASFCTVFPENPLGMLEVVTANAVWESCVNRIRSLSDGETIPLAAERLIVCLVHKGVSRDKIRIRHSHFTVCLDNCDYLILKRGEGVAVKPVNCAMRKSLILNADPCLIADAVLQYDAAIPEMKQASQRIYSQYRKKEIEHKIMEIVRDVRNETNESVPWSGMMDDADSDGVLTIR